MAETLDRWKPALLNGGTGLALLVFALVADGALSWPVLVGVAVALGWGWWVSPLRRAQPHVPQAEAARAAGRRGLIVYWRPGCRWCQKLWNDLEPGERERLTWVNVNADVEAAHHIRQFNDGDMVTPTVLTGAGRKVAATTEQIRARLR